MTHYDIIGDVHGHADRLEALLRTLGYSERAAGWVPPQGHQAVFVGDLIDRGGQQAETVAIVRGMVDAGHARCILGNHEYNAIAYTVRSESDPSRHLRQHSPRNVAQHAEFIGQVGEDSALHRECIGWFRTLPPALELDGIRVVHAWWNPDHVGLVNGQLAGQPMDDAFLQRAGVRGNPEWEAMEGLTKGLEVPLPAGCSFQDKEGVERSEVRVAWWDPQPTDFRAYAVLEEEQRHRVPAEPVPQANRYLADLSVPTFFGHYWMRGRPRVQSSRVACVDYSAAKDGTLVAYRWEGESDLVDGHFVEAA
jgi:hypothetical protein